MQKQTGRPAERGGELHDIYSHRQYHHYCNVYYQHSCAGVSANIAIIAVLLLIGMLTTRELVRALDGSRQWLIGRCLNISIIPLVISFAVIVSYKVIEIFG